MASRTSSPLTKGDLGLALLVVAISILLWALRGVAILVAFALLLAYMLDPFVSALERVPLPRRRNVPRALAALLVIVAVVGFIGWLAAIATPLLASQVAGFLERVPDLIEMLVADLRARAASYGWSEGFEGALESVRTNARTFVPQVAQLALRWVGGAFARLDQVLGFAVLPVLTFYLLADREGVRESLLRFLPEDVRATLIASGQSLDRALHSYVRGQALVCLIMGTATGTMLAIAGFPNALFLGVLAGLGEVLPFLGAALTYAAIVLSGLSGNLWLVVIGVALYTLNNWLLGTFVTPRVMERYLKLHPFAVIVSVLAGAQLMGAAGAILALPAVAVIQALVEDMTARRRRSPPE